MAVKVDTSVDLYPIKHRRQRRGSCGFESYVVLGITGPVPPGAVHTRSGQVWWTVGLLIQPVAVEVHVKLSYLGVLKVGEMQEYHEGKQPIIVPPHIGEGCVIASRPDGCLENRLGLHKTRVWFNGSGGRHVCPLCAAGCPPVSVERIEWKPS